MKPGSTSGPYLARPLASLFVRLFAYFFIVSALVLLATFYVTHRAELKDDVLLEQAPQIVQDLLYAQSHGGGLALDEQHDRVRMALRINAYLSQNGVSLGTRPMPPPAKERLAELREGQEARFKFDDGGRLLAIPVQISTTIKGHALLFAQQEGKAVASRQTLLYLQLVALLGTAAFVGWLVARALAAPIRHMQNAVNRVASGDLNSRVGNTLKTGINELSTLAHDIDHMAAQMQAMITSRDRLFHHLSHEMRSPLARLRILLELVREDEAGNSSRAHERLNKADYEIDRLDSMIDEILSLARFDGGQLPPMEPLLMTEIVNECVEFTKVEADAKSVQLRIDSEVPPEFDSVSGNRELIVRAIDNLLRNAIRYTPADQVVDIAIRCEGIHVLVSVGDQGPGVPEAYLGAIFEPFFRLPTSKPQAESRQERGYGLGLTFVHLVSKLHGATVVASNKMSGGLLIEIRFSKLIKRAAGNLPHLNEQDET
jgi:two-component system, OmpR family, sensor kinase